MKGLDSRLRNYKTIQARINIIDLDIELKKLSNQDFKDLLRIKKLFENERSCIDNLLKKLNEQELFIISLLYNTNISMTDLAILLNRNRTALHKKISDILKKLNGD